MNDDDYGLGTGALLGALFLVLAFILGGLTVAAVKS